MIRFYRKKWRKFENTDRNILPKPIVSNVISAFSDLLKPNIFSSANHGGRHRAPPPFENFLIRLWLGITIDSEMKFEKHSKDICNKASQKIHVLSRTTSYMLLNKGRLLMETFVESQFNYCPLIWMFHSRLQNNKINNVHKNAVKDLDLFEG